MINIEDTIPNGFIEQSLGFKTAILVAGALILLFSTLIRPTYPVLWIPLFLFGGLIEWLIIATVYVEISQLEEETQKARRDIETTLEEVRDVQQNIQNTQKEIEDTKDSVFSFISKSQGPGIRDSIEDRVSAIENKVGTRRGGKRNSLERRVSQLEDKIEDLERDRF